MSNKPIRNGGHDRDRTCDPYHVRLKRDVVEREFNEISVMRPASLTPTQLALGPVWA